MLAVRNTDHDIRPAMNKLQKVEQMLIEQATALRGGEPLPDFGPGDTITVSLRVIEGDKERIQNFTGVVIARRGSGPNKTFRVRKISNGVGVERVFPLYSPFIEKITVERRGHVRRAKLFYLRGMSERKIRRKLHQD